MKSRPAIVTGIVLAVTLAAADATPRVGLVKIKEIYAAMPAVQRLQEEVKEARLEIIRDPRAEELRQALNELQELEAKLSNKTNPPEGETGRKLAEAYEIKRQAAQTLQREFEVFREEQEKEINRRMIAEMRAMLDTVADTARRLAEERGYDMLLDSSGYTNTGLPFVLYSKSPDDLTDDVRAALKDSGVTVEDRPAPGASVTGTTANPTETEP